MISLKILILIDMQTNKFLDFFFSFMNILLFTL